MNEKINNLLGKNLLVINTGTPKKRFIFQKLKKLGLKIIILNKIKNWAQTYADDWILADTYNHAEVIQGIKAYLSSADAKIDGAITFWEDDIPLLAEVAKEFKLTGNSLPAAVNTRDKFRMQEMLKKCGLPHIKQQLLKTKADLENAKKEIGFPAVIKPLFGSDSQYVVYVSSDEEASDAYNYVLKNCTPENDPIYIYNRRMFVYQEYIEGHEFSMEGFSQHGVPQVIGLHEKTAMNLPFFMETGDYLPPRVNEEQIEKLKKITEASLIVLGVRDSLFHVEAKLTNNGPKVIEVASRMGGDYVFENISEVYSFDLIKAGIEIALGINVEETPKPQEKYIMGKYFIPKNSGIITKIKGFENLKNEKNLITHYLHKEVGDSVLVPPEGYENIGWVLVEGNSYTEIEQTMHRITEMVDIEVAPFRSYSSFGKSVRKNHFSPALFTPTNVSAAKKIAHLKKTDKETLKNLHIGLACNIYDGGNQVEEDLMSVGKNIEKTLKDRGYRVTFFDFNNLPKTFNELKESDVDLIFNVCERINDSSLLEPHAAAILDTLQIPYTGSNPLTLALCIDKIRVKKLLNYHNIPTPRWDYAYSLEDEINEDLRFPLIVKPANTDNSIGITNESVVVDKKQLEAQLKKVIDEIGCPALVEEYIEGDEYDVSIMGNDDEGDLRVLPLSRSIFKDMPEGYWHIYPYNAKWTDDPVYKNITTQQPPKNISKKLESLLTEIAIDTYNILDCHDYGRVEIRVDENDNPYVLELNPNPSINIGDIVPYVATLIGMEFGDFIEEIIKSAIRRYKNKPPYNHLQSNMM